jgi:hypothetical protein
MNCLLRQEMRIQTVAYCKLKYFPSSFYNIVCTESFSHSHTHSQKKKGHGKNNKNAKSKKKVYEFFFYFFGSFFYNTASFAIASHINYPQH